MARRLLLVPVALLLALALAIDATADNDSRLRPLGTHARKVVQDAERWSTTVWRLVQRIERSDVIVYVELGAVPPGTGATTTLVSAAPASRFVVVTLDPLAGEAILIARLGHELRHVVEIADAPEVCDAPGMRVMLARIGWRSGPDRWETAGAVDAGRQVERELSRHVRVATLVARATPQ